MVNNRDLITEYNGMAALATTTTITTATAPPAAAAAEEEEVKVKVTLSGRVVNVLKRYS
jgi:hypothetical protein